MRTTYSPYILALVCTTSLTVRAQVPITPLWSHVDLFGAGFWYPEFDALSTRVAFDPGSEKLYRSIMPDGIGSYCAVQVFDVDGNDISPSPGITFQGLPGNIDGMWTDILRLSAGNDTLAAVIRFGNSYWLKVKEADGSPVLLLGVGSGQLNEFQQDTAGSLLLTSSELRSYGPTGWPNGTAITPNAGRMAVVGSEVFLGAPPSITRIERGTMTPLTPIAVPSTGTAITSVCLANTSSAFNYAAVNNNGTMDVGLADSNIGSVWSTTVPIPSGAEPTAYHVDELGNFWIAFVQNGVGLLYRFYQSGGPFAESSFSRRIDDIASSGNRLFLTGRVEGTTESTYLAAFDIDLITGVPNRPATSLSASPNPANDRFILHGNTTWTEGWITDATGKTVLSITQAELSSGSMAISDLAVGSYRLSVRNAKGTAQLPFVIAR